MAWLLPEEELLCLPPSLSVPVEVARIFTGMSISPSPSPRQRPNRYAFRAGQNLPDNEFRYLRIVIVTTAVDWGFGCQLPPSQGGGHQLP
jgi:hypothetical protein